MESVVAVNNELEGIWNKPSVLYRHVNEGNEGIQEQIWETKVDVYEENQTLYFANASVTTWATLLGSSVASLTETVEAD